MAAVNGKYSQEQRPKEPEWNVRNCRIGRLYKDRAGIKACCNRSSFFIQIYKRDMGGDYALLKDISAPIIISGKLWGCLRIIYKA